MLPRMLRLHTMSYRRLIRLCKLAEQKGACRGAKCLPKSMRSS